ncbi:hypothetical protein AVEN_2477-1 [Araneus ventricosus]|uniref:Uncharacterized protein n=1 Tax=Araneus ventricosus TaxID=182803 RepID=A0A4Y2PBB6_ARAVE|nr:hypothetical protein AVEN_2477-1 [Araneus ventricosus]
MFQKWAIRKRERRVDETEEERSRRLSTTECTTLIGQKTEKQKNKGKDDWQNGQRQGGGKVPSVWYAEPLSQNSTKAINPSKDSELSSFSRTNYSEK